MRPSADSGIAHGDEHLGKQSNQVEAHEHSEFGRPVAIDAPSLQVDMLDMGRHERDENMAGPPPRIGPGFERPRVRQITSGYLQYGMGAIIENLIHLAQQYGATVFRAIE